MPPCVAHPNFLRKKIYRHSAWTSDARSSVAGTLTLKQCSRVHQNTPFSFRKLKPSLGAYGFRPSRFRRSTFAPFKNSKYTTRGLKNTGLENIGPNSYNRSSTSSTRHPPLTLSPPIPLKLYTLPYWSNPPFSIFDIRALWRSGLSARAPECQKLKMVG